MDAKVLSKLTPDNQAKMAVAYLIRHRHDAPEGVQRFFDKLQQYEDSMKDLFMAIREAEASLNELAANQEQLKGSISAIVELIAGELDEETVKKACAEFEMPPMSPQMAGSVPPVQAGSSSMAGETSKMQPPPMPTPPGQ